MPLYEYECFLCRKRFERIQRVSDDQVSECPSCGGAVRRILGVPALQFKGSGWYVTDYGKGNGSKAGKSEEKEEKKETPTASSEAKPAEKDSAKSTNGGDSKST
jgi:putative FmdB family regulatory protein